MCTINFIALPISNPINDSLRRPLTEMRKLVHFLKFQMPVNILDHAATRLDSNSKIRKDFYPPAPSMTFLQDVDSWLMHCLGRKVEKLGGVLEVLATTRVTE